MSVNLSIKHVPDVLAERLRKRAERHHRSLQGELMAILEQNLGDSERLTPVQVLQRVREMGLRSASESTELIRLERDAH